ncbi:MAG TPA: hypothetical protein ENG48_11285 [Candidatus Atribacteria bacterium]|nr:hypothetical protein [Candidatus Atribacteria bacterium]
MEMKAWIEAGFEYKRFLYSLKKAKEPEDIYIPYAYTELTILKEWGYRLTKTTVWSDLSLFTQMVIKYHTMIDAKLQEWQNKQTKRKSSSQNNKSNFKRR